LLTAILCRNIEKHNFTPMLKRIVRMTFREDATEAFLTIFNASRFRIRHFEGCHSLELLRDKHQPNVFVTLSVWQSEEHLNAYRDSELFKATWSATKALFLDKPMAFSLDSEQIVE
jgi:quinol monooxygenase YgiN